MKKFTQEEIIEKAKKVHNNFYDYSLVEYVGMNQKVKIICPKHGVFEQRPNAHLMNKGCFKCRSSKGEEEVKRVLGKLNIEFIEQHKFENCRDKRVLMFDFYIPLLNTCIEYDGEQHFRALKNFGREKSFTRIQKSDLIKNNYCLENNIKLIRIPYTDFSKIEKRLKGEIKKRLTKFNLLVFFYFISFYRKGVLNFPESFLTNLFFF